MQIYRTQENESIYDVARRFGVSPIKVAEDNELEIRGTLPQGRELLIRIPSRTYNAKSSDTLEGISRRFKTTKEALLRLNPELRGRERIYSGQLLTVKDSTPSYGMISSNGYLYSGTSRERLVSMIPYLSYVTVCAAVYKDGKVHRHFSCEDAVSLIKSTGRAPILRIYLTELPTGVGEADFASSIAILAKSGGFDGVALSSLNTMSTDKDRLEGLVLSVRKALIENDLLLFAEGEADKPTSYMDYADAGVLTYDKLHHATPPSFDEGERMVFSNYADSSESCRAFIELSGFAYYNDRYIEKHEAMRICDRKHVQLCPDDERLLTVASYGKNKKRTLVFENLENTKSKLELISELGFMGICFDIGRICICDLMAATSMFDVISHPIMRSKAYGQEM